MRQRRYVRQGDGMLSPHVDTDSLRVTVGERVLSQSQEQPLSRGVVGQLRCDRVDVRQRLSASPRDPAVELEVDRSVVMKPASADLAWLGAPISTRDRSTGPAGDQAARSFGDVLGTLATARLRGLRVVWMQ